MATDTSPISVGSIIVRRPRSRRLCTTQGNLQVMPGKEQKLKRHGAASYQHDDVKRPGRNLNKPGRTIEITRLEGLDHGRPERAEQDQEQGHTGQMKQSLQQIADRWPLVEQPCKQHVGACESTGA